MRRTFGICFLVLLSAFCLWKYAERLTPMERLHSGNFSLEQLQREKCVIITDLCEIKKAELWEDFITEKIRVQHRIDERLLCGAFAINVDCFHFESLPPKTFFFQRSPSV